MHETTPHYFIEFQKELFGKVEEFEGKFRKIDGWFEKIDKRFDGIEEQIADLSVKVTHLEIDVKDIKEEMKVANRRADRHSEKILIGIAKLSEHDTRITNLEKEMA